MSGNALEYSRLMSKDVSSWGVSEVGMWLDFIHLSDYKITFIENCVTGQELPELGAEDLVMLGVKSLGHRKRLQKEIANINAKKRHAGGGGDDFDSDNDSSDSDSSRSSGHSSSVSSNSSRKSETTFSYGPTDRVRVKFSYKGDVSVAYVSASASRRKLLRKARKECRGVRVELTYKDAEGDKIGLKKDKDIKAMFRHMKPPIRLECKVSSTRSSSRAARSDDAIPASETAVLDTLNDAAVIIDAHCTVRYINDAGLKMWDYPRSEVIGQNVKMLMAAAYASRHDQIVERYVQGITTAKVIGKGARQVMGKNAHGDPFPMKLSLTETKQKGRHTFTGTCVRVADIGGAAGYGALDALLESAIVISQTGSLLYLNNGACELFGYKREDVLGQNVKMLMPSPYRENHDFYLANYLKTGVKQVIGKTRHVLAEKADGSVIPITLAVCQKLNEATDKYTFTGMVRVREGHNAGVKVSVLKQEREVVNGLMVPGIIINEQCEIQAFNRAASKLLGYDLAEVLGSNVKMVVPPAHAAKHDSYIDNYLKTGVAKVIGKERILAARRKDGKLIKIQLSVTEKSDGDKKFFTGMFHGV